MTDPLWRPSIEKTASTNLTAFTKKLEQDYALSLQDYDALHRFSLEAKEAFWTAVWDFAGIIAESRGTRVLVDGDKMPGAQFFPDAKLNFAENLLRLSLIHI